MFIFFNLFNVFSLTKMLDSLTSYTLSAHAHRSCLYTRDLLFGKGLTVWVRVHRFEIDSLIARDRQYQDYEENTKN
jgi:hypothetical protein